MVYVRKIWMWITTPYRKFIEERKYKKRIEELKKKDPFIYK